MLLKCLSVSGGCPLSTCCFSSPVNQGPARLMGGGDDARRAALATPPPRPLTPLGSRPPSSPEDAASSASQSYGSASEPEPGPSSADRLPAFDGDSSACRWALPVAGLLPAAPPVGELTPRAGPPLSDAPFALLALMTTGAGLLLPGCPCTPACLPPTRQHDSVPGLPPHPRQR